MSGLSVLMFVAGNSIVFSRTERISQKTWVITGAALGVLFPAFATAELLIGLVGGNPGSNACEVLVYHMVVTLCVAVTSVPFLTKILHERGLLRTVFAKTVLLAACIVDLVLWVALSAVHSVFRGELVDAVGPGNVLTPNLSIYVVTLVFVKTMRAYTKHYGTPISSALAEFSFSIGLLVVTICLARAIGGELMISALCAGIIHANCGFISGLDKILWHRTEMSVVPLYFATIGVSLTLAGTFSTWQMVAFIFWSSALKIGLVQITLEFLYPKDVGNGLFSVAMNTRGRPGIAMASFAFASGMIDDRTFLTLIAASFITAFITDWYIQRNSGVIRCQI